MVGILEHLKWESLKKWRRDSRLILLYKGMKGKASIPTDGLIPLVRRCRNDHSMAYQVPSAYTDIYKCSSPPPRPLGIGMHFQTLLSPLLKVPRMVLLSSLLWWELGTSLPGRGPRERLGFWRVTSKQFRFWFWFRVPPGDNPRASASGLSPVKTHGLYIKQLIVQLCICTLCIKRYLMLNIGTVQ